MNIQTRCIFMEDTHMCGASTEENHFSLSQIYYKYAGLNTRHISAFDVLLTVHLSIFILVID